MSVYSVAVYSGCEGIDLEGAKSIVVSKGTFENELDEKLNDQIKLYCLSRLFDNDNIDHSNEITFFVSNLSEYIVETKKERIRRGPGKGPKWKKVKRWLHFPPRIWVEQNRKSFYLERFKLTIEFLTDERFEFRHEI